MTNTTQWFAFRAYNSQTIYGFGSDDEASQYADHLNANREVNLYAPYSLSEAEATELKLEDNTEAFNLDDALQGIEE